MKLTFSPTKTIMRQLKQISKMTRRPVKKIVNDLLAGPLNQIVELGDTDYLQVVTLR